MYKVNILPDPNNPGQYYATEPFEVPTPVIVDIDRQGIVTFPNGIPPGFNIGYGFNGTTEWKSFLDWTAHVIRTERPDLVDTDPLGVNYWSVVKCHSTVLLIEYHMVDVFSWGQIPVQGAVIFSPVTNRPDYIIDSGGNRHPWGYMVTSIPPVWYMSTNGVDPHASAPIQEQEHIKMSLTEYVVSLIKKWLRIT